MSIFIGFIIDKLIFIGAGIILLTQLKRINKPFIKWIAIGLILIGVIQIIIELFK